MFSALLSCDGVQEANTYEISGALRQYQPVSLSFKGPMVSEQDSVNPFLAYALWVEFDHEGQKRLVPGFYAADGNAAHSSADTGNIWKVNFRPDAIGEYRFKAFFHKGKDIAVAPYTQASEKEPLWMQEGRFTVAEVDSAATGFYSKGPIRYVDDHFLRYDRDGEAFLKNGVGSPETFLAYHEFDGTVKKDGAVTPTLADGLHQYPTHVSDWEVGDPTWANGKGKGIIGAINYLVSKGMNSLYFLVMNEHGDGDNIWPWTGPYEQTRYDVSKLAQWDILFGHMAAKGMAMNLFTQETENDTILNKGELGLERKLYYKELIARFGHQPAIVWNLGEETNRTTEQLKAYASYIRDIDPNDHPIAVHNHVRITGERFQGRPMDPIKETLEPLLGYKDFEIPALQLYDTTEVYVEVQKWRHLSKEKGRPWVVYLDEIGHWDIGVTTDVAPNNNYDMVMHSSLWGSLMAGAAGTSWYFGGLDGPNNDMAAEDFRARDGWWTISNHAMRFFREHLPFTEMENAGHLVSNTDAYCLAKEGDTYVVYLPKNTETNLSVLEGSYTKAYFDPKEGGGLQSVSSMPYKGEVRIAPPNNGNKDWVVLLKRIRE